MELRKVFMVLAALIFAGVVMRSCLPEKKAVETAPAAAPVYDPENLPELEQNKPRVPEGPPPDYSFHPAEPDKQEALPETELKKMKLAD